MKGHNFIEGSLFTTEDIETQPKKRGRKKLPIVWEERPSLTEEEMREKLTNLKEIESSTGIRYVQMHVTKRMIIGIRESSGKEFTINLNELYNAYQYCTKFTSPEVKKHIFMGHSPALAILRMLKSGKQQEDEHF